MFPYIKRLFVYYCFYYSCLLLNIQYIKTKPVGFIVTGRYIPFPISCEWIQWTVHKYARTCRLFS